jgi:hypothetical protein
MTEFKPAEYFDPREYLDDELKARGQTIKDCLGTVRRWYYSTDPMPPRVAWAIAVFFGHTHSEGWLNLDRVWQSRPQDAAPSPPGAER